AGGAIGRNLGREREMDQDEAFRRVWQTFRTFDRLADGRHNTADWRSHEGQYALCVVRVPPNALDPRLDECRRALAAHPHVRMHPDRFLHISLQELGFVCETPGRPDEITRRRLEEFATSAVGAIAERAPFDVLLGGINSFQDAAFLDVHDGGACAQLHARLFELAGVQRSPRYAYLPHVTVGHYTAGAPADGLAADLAPWRDTRFAAFRATEIEIVTLRLDEPYPPLESYAVLPLRG
ncbi:MAG: 2'-5' RNA ligase family protein, partial [Chloroflexota bacterium]|nr:2'-5' RNA ligase family protein [Chloroflexota bacterium]